MLGGVCIQATQGIQQPTSGNVCVFNKIKIIYTISEISSQHGHCLSTSTGLRYENGNFSSTNTPLDHPHPPTPTNHPTLSPKPSSRILVSNRHSSHNPVVQPILTAMPTCMGQLSNTTFNTRYASKQQKTVCRRSHTHRSPLSVKAAATFDAVSFLKKAFFKNSTPSVQDAAFAANLIAEVGLLQADSTDQT